jgi:16S rRNA (guanine527-N7)-methyltransferase
LNKLLRAAGITLTRPQVEQLWTYHSLLHKRNADRDLTRIVGFESMVLRHYVDSMIIGDFIQIPSPLLDIGTGAGFPGIPLKIRYPGLHITLAEPRPRRVEFLKDARAALKLENVEVFDHRVVSASFRRRVKGVITRAFEPMEKTLARTAGCTVAGARFLFMKGPSADQELRETLARYKAAIRLVLDKHFTLPDSTQHRRLIVLERVTDPPAGLVEEPESDGGELED